MRVDTGDLMEIIKEKLADNDELHH
jgi:hypothetical protein